MTPQSEMKPCSFCNGNGGKGCIGTTSWEMCRKCGGSGNTRSSGGQGLVALDYDEIKSIISKLNWVNSDERDRKIATAICSKFGTPAYNAGSGAVSGEVLFKHFGEKGYVWENLEPQIVDYWNGKAAELCGKERL